VVEQLRRVLVCLLLSVPAFGAAITSAASGDWNATGTWVGGAIPGDGDTVIIANGHTVTIPSGVSVTVGDAANPATYAIATAGTGGTGVLVVAGTLILHGNVKHGNATWVLSPGSDVQFDHASAILTWQIADSTGQTNAYLNMIGVGWGAGQFVTVHSTGTTNGKFTGSTGGGRMRAAYFKWTRIGDASNNATTGIPTTGHESYWHHGKMDQCGQLAYASGLANGFNVSVHHIVFTNSLGVRNIDWSVGTVYTAGVREIYSNDFDKTVRFIGGAGVDFYDNTLQSDGSNPEISNTAGSGSPQPGWHDLLVWRRRSTESNWPGGDNPISRVYAVFDYEQSGSDNPHGFAQVANNAYYDGWILDSSGLMDNDRAEGDFIFNKARTDGGTAITDVRNCILLPTGLGWNPGKLINALNSPSGGSTVDIRAEHNTVFVGRTGETGVFNWGETWAGAVGGATSVKSNLAWRGASETVGGLLINRTNSGSVQDFALPANITHNACWQCATGTDGYGYNATVTTPTATAFTSAPAAPLNADPQLVDPTRNIKTWDAALGGPGTIAHAFEEIRKRNDPDATYNPAYTITALYDWVRAGYAPTNPAYKGAAHDGGDIGAVEAIVAARKLPLLMIW
jgi:hypothetical protein